MRNVTRCPVLFQKGVRLTVDALGGTETEAL
jgi:hypothetical protein